MTIGILGAGQLGRMLALAGYPLGLRPRFYDQVRDAPAGALGPLTVGAFDDLDALSRFARECDVITYEFENVPVATAQSLEARRPVFPPPMALRVAQDRVTEKAFFRDLGAGTAEYVAVDTFADLERSARELGLPLLLKTRRLGYDGKGQALIRDAGAVRAAWENLSRDARTRGLPADLVAEAFVAFRRELSVIAARGQGGEVVAYPLVENRHERGILAESIAPAPRVSAETQRAAHTIATAAVEALGYVGVIAIELFELGDGSLLVNEMAPRVHNSGHWTIEGAQTSQFENHIRAIAGLPLGSAEAAGVSGMLNAVGTLPDARAVLAIPGTHLHNYGKAPRPGRKLGHVTVRGNDHADVAGALDRLRPLVPRVLAG